MTDNAPQNLPSMLITPLTLGQASLQLRQHLATLGLPAEQVQAEANRLLEHVTQLSSTQRLANPEALLSDDACKSLNTMLLRRISVREPLQYVLGQADFYGRVFQVSPAVLIPRPETELLVEEAIKRLQNTLLKSTTALQVLDIGTGSGCIAISLACELRSQVHITAVDISAEALKVASANAERLGVASCVQFLQSDVYTVLVESSVATSTQAGPRFDLIVSNPPYIDCCEQATMLPEVLQHEPLQALFATQAESHAASQNTSSTANPDQSFDRFSVYRRIIQKAPDFLKPGGWLLLELGTDCELVLLNFIAQAGLTHVATLPDYAGVPRVLVALASAAPGSGL